MLVKVNALQKHKIFLLKLLIHLLSFLPVAYLYTQAINDTLSSDPVKEIIHFTGIGALNLLLITLLVSPLAKKIKQGWLIQVRRLLGLYAFFYACLHILNFLFFDLQLDFSLFLKEIIDRPYITIGMLGFVIIFLLAITSINVIKRNMGKRWQTLHNFNYLLCILSCVHFYWSVKSEIIEPLIYFIILLVLLYSRKAKLTRLINLPKHGK